MSNLTLSRKKGTVISFRTSFFMVLFFLFIPSILHAQSPTFTNYTNVDGLPSDEIYMVLQDHYGYIWMATNYGVSRFDGYHFENFTTEDGLTDNTVYELYEDFKGRMWFITSNLKFSYFDGDKIKSYQFNDEIGKELSWAPYYENRSFYLDSLDNLYFSVYLKGTYKVNPKGKVSIVNSTCIWDWSINAISENKFILSRKKGEIITDTIGFVSNNKINFYKIKKSVRSYATSILFVSSKKQVYYSLDNYLYKTDIKGENLHTYKMLDYIISVDEDSDGNLWIGLRNDGAMCYKNGDLSKQPFLHVLRGLPVSKICSDTEGGLWFSTTTNGLFYTPTLNILNYTKQDGLIDNQIYGINNCKKNELSVYFRNNRYNVIKDDMVLIKNENLPVNENIELVQNEFNRKWIVTNKMTYISENGVTKRIIDKFPVPNIFDKLIWNPTSVLCLNSDLAYLSFTSFIGKAYKNELKLITSSEVLVGISTICYGADSIIYFGSKIGPGWVEGDSIKMFNKKFPELKIKINHLLYNNNDSSLWIATKGDGIYILKNNLLSNISVKNGLSSNFVKHLYQYEGKIWISTNEGINIAFKDIPKDSFYIIKKINSNMGLISNEINMICASDDKIYAATDKGLSYFTLSDIRFGFNRNKPVKITQIEINEKDTAILDTYILPFDSSSIKIKFKYLSYTNAGKHKYIYRLKGLSDEWQITGLTEVYYTSLPPGQYTFEVKFLSPDNIKSESTQTLEFIIQKPYWQTWWFMTLILLFVTIIVYAIYRYRIRIISRQNKLERQLIEYQSKALSSQINPHFIFNSLNSIQLYVLNNDIVKSNKYLTKFSNLMRSVLENSQETSISLETEIQTLTNYIEIESIRFQSKFEYEIKIDSDIDIKKVRIPTLLIQPFVENAIWHGLMNKEEKGFLSVSMIDIGSSLKVVIQDNGIGRIRSNEINLSKSSTHKSLGAQITQERLKLLNTLYKSDLKILITDLYSKTGISEGTKIEINIPKLTK